MTHCAWMRGGEEPLAPRPSTDLAVVVRMGDGYAGRLAFLTGKETSLVDSRRTPFIRQVARVSDGWRVVRALCTVRSLRTQKPYRRGL
jgi:hypothetical protein